MKGERERERERERDGGRVCESRAHIWAVFQRYMALLWGCRARLERYGALLYSYKTPYTHREEEFAREFVELRPQKSHISLKNTGSSREVWGSVVCCIVIRRHTHMYSN